MPSNKTDFIIVKSLQIMSLDKLKMYDVKMKEVYLIDVAINQVKSKMREWRE